ncbi:MAG: threonine--tRNA ligase [Candidatus Omnitrophica bacterium CG11_big_fil_rev_8_21_14_0_20_64_10]|nr:MAG: threonine--tRNA ligase [Candidatus Omnitrophica bacterium CG11_big_fil_rev_8_21_14_0_20_64_10]
MAEQKIAQAKKQDLHALRHSAAHIMAQAVRRLYPGTQVAIGPVIEDGFYYDLKPTAGITEADLPKIEAEMKKIAAADYPFVRSAMPKAEALKQFQAEPFKCEVIQGIPDPEVSIYTDGDFVDLCAGPHVGSTGELKAFKLLSVAGAYWRGSERNPMLTRIYGTAFNDPAALDEFLKTREEAARRDHRKLGVQLKLFSILEEAGAGLVFYHPRGAVLRGVIEEYARQQHARRGYLPVVTPHVIKSGIWTRSGHYEHYKENMYIFKMENQEWGLKPMNCPGHILIYERDLHSYRELPLRFFELGTVYRNEKSGVLHGLLRVRGFTQDDAHIFCRPGQLESELTGILDFVREAMLDFGFPDYRVEMSTRPADFAGDPAVWEKAEGILEKALKDSGIPYEISAGAGAFYGPKIDVHVQDSLKRTWQCATAQLDFVLPQRFGLKYVEEDGKEAVPIMIHRAIFGSLERFIGMLIEHHGGAFPVWLAPVQAVVIPLTKEQEAYAARTAETLKAGGIRVEVDDRRQTLQARIRDAQLMKTPFMLIVGKREEAAGAVAVRSRSGGDQGAVPVGEFLKTIQQAIKERHQG